MHFTEVIIYRFTFGQKGLTDSPLPFPTKELKSNGGCRYMDLISLNEMDIYPCMNLVSLWLIYREYDVLTSHAPHCALSTSWAALVDS